MEADFQPKHTSHPANPVNDIVYHLLPNGIVATGVVVGGILLAADEELGMEELPVAARSDLVNGRRVQVDEDGARDVFAIASFGEKRLERAGITDILGVGVWPAIGPETVFKEITASESTTSPQLAGGGVAYPYSSQALLPSWVPAWPRCR